MKISKNELILFFLIIIGIIIRFWNIGFQHINYDEEFTLSFASPTLTFMEVFIQSLSTDYTPPLYYLFAHASMCVFGAIPEAIRYPSAIFGILLIPAIYFLGKEYKDELFGLLMAGFTTIFYNAIFYSKYGRSYSLLLLLFTITFYFFMRVLKGEKNSGLWFGIFAMLSMWTHLYSCIPIGVMVLYLLYHRFNLYYYTKLLYGLIIMFICCLPLLNYINLIFVARSIIKNVCDFGNTPIEILFLTPLDLFAYSVFIIFPIIVYSCWKYRDDTIIRVISLVSITTWVSMIILSLKTPIILHYAILLVPVLLIAFVLPFYEAIINKKVYFHHLIFIMIILILEIVQILALVNIQRGSW